MLTGQRTFAGDDISEVLASVLKTDPEWTAIPADVSPSVRRLLRRCLEKDPRKRLSSIGDARLELDEIESAVTTTPAPVAVGKPPRTFGSMLIPAAAGALVTAAIAAGLWTTVRPAPDALITRLSVIPDAGADIYPDSAEVAISPDGRSVVYVVGDPQLAVSQLWVRSLDSVVARRLEGGDGAHLPFWSPDGSRIGFTAGLKLKTIPAQGGRVDVVCNAPGFRGGAWNKNDIILFAPDASGALFQVSANGGEPKAVTKLDASRKETGHRFPTFLPDGDHFLFAALPGTDGLADIVAGSLRDGTQVLVGAMESAPVYAEPGWLLFARRGVLAAQRFDAGTLKLSGEPVPLNDEPSAVLDAETAWTAGYAASVASSGAIAYFSLQSVNTSAVWLDSAGKPGGTVNLPGGRYVHIRISPDGTRAALVRSASRTESAVLLADIQRGGATPVSTGRGLNGSPVWSPNSDRIVFSGNRNGPNDVFIKNILETTSEQTFYQSSVAFKNPDTWSPDGKWIALRQLDSDTAQNVYLLPTTGEVVAQPYVMGPGRDEAVAISPNGRWMAYLGEDTGAQELYAQGFPKPGGRVQISTEGALWAWWADEGRRLVFVESNRMRLMTVDVSEGDAIKVSTPRLLATFPKGIVWIDAMPDRQRFLALLPERTGTGTVTVVQNWMAALKK
jgi:Tol biopolymer transport system component